LAAEKEEGVGWGAICGSGMAGAEGVTI
jgi:hypothetical protein